MNDIIQTDQKPTISHLAQHLVHDMDGVKLRHLSTSQLREPMKSHHKALFNQVRILRQQISKKHSVNVTITSPIIACILKHAAWMLSRHQAETEGVVERQRRTTSDLQQPNRELGETVVSNKEIKAKKDVTRPVMIGN